ncbi:uncharacterized protein LOC110006606 isoform X4 [Amborella trichopoda]|uniref:uncharacterized protein LOC110006606 isoform X4 n=1 Tax=Amborella trichopoda TaxID=13333 RepID=UPI0009BEC584|nr:uncharacterized protein LOC110006606 isoform X4 [Amborella trichopoda]|eukprot:XP_020518343.1 uncharacterized protein LOC110006606 isoform X4 [Amborella trichopoda]
MRESKHEGHIFEMEKGSLPSTVVCVGFNYPFLSIEHENGQFLDHCPLKWTNYSSALSQQRLVGTTCSVQLLHCARNISNRAPQENFRRMLGVKTHLSVVWSSSFSLASTW